MKNNAKTSESYKYFFKSFRIVKNPWEKYLQLVHLVRVNLLYNLKVLFFSIS